MNTTFRFDQEGTGECLYTEALPLPDMFTINDIRRWSTVEFSNVKGKWEVRLNNCPEIIFESESRKDCIEFEHNLYREVKERSCQPRK